MKDLVASLAGIADEPEDKELSQENASQNEHTFGFAASSTPLYRTKAPRHELRSEKPWHRTVAYLSVKGLSEEEIANAVGRNKTSVNLVRQQPFYGEMCAKLISDFNLLEDSAVNLLKNAASTASMKLIDLMENSKSDAVKLTAATAVLDRVFGKPTQRVERNDKTPSAVDPSAELAELHRDIAKLTKSSPVVRDVANLNA